MRLAAKVCTALLAALSALSMAVAAAPGIQTGDMVFQQSRSAQSLAIQQATHSPYSHMASSGVSTF